MSQPKIITLDIETAPIEAYVWGLFKQYVGLDQIKHDWSILAFAAKTLGKKGVRYFDNRDEDDVRDDTNLLALLWDELDQADIVVTQNGISFDQKKINARFIEKGWPPPSPYRSIDTKVEAQRIAKFTSNKLEWLAAILTDEKKDRHNEFPGFSLWAEALKGNPRAWKAMEKYNHKDVTTTEKVYLALRPWIAQHPNLGAYSDGSRPLCPKCGSKKVTLKGLRTTQIGQYHRFRCNSCGGWSHTRHTHTPLAQRRNQLGN